MLDTKELLYFIAVAKNNSFTKASNVLHLTQPTITRTIQILEDKLGYQLFIRKSHSVSLTEQGVLFYKRAKEIIDLIAETQEEFTNIKDNISGNIKIGCGETLGFNIIADALQNLQQKHKKVTFCIESDDAEDIFYKINLGLLDFGLVLEPIKINDDYNFLQLPYHDIWGILIDKESALAKEKDYVTKDDLISVPLMVSNQLIKNVKESEDFNFLLDEPYKNNIIGTYNLIFNASLLAQKNKAAVLCINNLINTNDPKCSLKFLEYRPQIKTNIMLVWKKSAVILPAQQAFLDTLTENLDKK